MSDVQTVRSIQSHPHLVGLLLVSILGLVLRSISLNSGLWVDEIYSMVNQYRIPIAELVTSYPGDNQHTFYAILANLSHSIFGEHAWAVRLPALLFGAASIPALYLLALKVTSKREALLSALILSVSYHHVWFSQNARGYTILAFATILGTYLLIRALSEKHRGMFLAYASVAALGAYTHLIMVFVVVGHFLVWLWTVASPPRPEVGWRYPLGGFVLAGVFTLILYAPLLPDVIDYFVNKPSQMVGVSTPLWALQEAVRMLEMGMGAGGLVILSAVTLVLCVGITSYFRQNATICALFLAPVLVTLLGAAAARGTMYPRFFFFLSGFAILFAVRGSLVTTEFVLQRIFREGMSDSLRQSLSVLAVCLVVALSTTSLPYNYRYPKMDFVRAISWVQSKAQPQDTIVSAGITSWPINNYFAKDWVSVEDARQLDAVRNRGKRVWMIYAFPDYMTQALSVAIAEDCREAERFHGTLGGGDVIVCHFSEKPAEVQS